VPRRAYRAIGLVAALGLAPVAADAQQDGETGAEDDRGRVERGQYLIRAGGCITCHSKDGDDAVPLAGGRALETRFGTFHTPNITPDSATGIGDWTAEDFVRALTRGIAPDGAPYYPAFPYPSYAGIRESDARAMFAYLQSIDPVRREVPPHELDVPYNLRTAVWGWRWLFFDAGTFRPDPAKSRTWNRGAYLVRHLGHCGECHTPRNRLGATIAEQHLAGNPAGPEGTTVPNITPHDDAGIGDWDATDITFFLETGFLPNGDVAGSGMSAVIRDGTRHLTDADRTAIATYLLRVEPKPGPTAEPDDDGS